jgi:hypothetical protein
MSRRLGTYRLEVVGSPAYFARAGLPGMPEDLTVHACLHRKYPTTGKLQRWPFTRSATGGEVTLPTTATASTVDALISLAEYGVGIACVPDFSIRRQIADGSLVGVLKQHMEHTETFRAIWPASRHVSPKLRAFIDFFAENLLPKVFPERIPDLSLSDLRARWSRLYGRVAPTSFRRKFLAKAIAYQMQVEANGGLPEAIKRRLRDIAEAAGNGTFDAAMVGAHQARHQTRSHLAREYPCSDGA